MEFLAQTISKYMSGGNPVNIYLIQKEVDGKTIYPNHDLDFAKAHHFVLGYDFFVTENLRIKVEPYYQRLYNIPVVDSTDYSMVNYVQEFSFDRTLINKGTAVNYGIELTVEKFFNKGYYYLLTGSFFNSEYTGGNDITHSTRYNQGVVANALFGKEFYVGKSKNNILGINGRLVYANGMRLSPIDLEASRLAQTTIFNNSSAFSDQEPSTTFMDFTLTFRRNKPKYSSIWAIQVKNVFGANNIYDKYFDTETQQITEFEQKLIIPIISYKIEF